MTLLENTEPNTQPLNKAELDTSRTAMTLPEVDTLQVLRYSWEIVEKSIDARHQQRPEIINWFRRAGKFAVVEANRDMYTSVLPQGDASTKGKLSSNEKRVALPGTPPIADSPKLQVLRAFTRGSDKDEIDEIYRDGQRCIAEGVPTLSLTARLLVRSVLSEPKYVSLEDAPITSDQITNLQLHAQAQLWAESI